MSFLFLFLQPQVNLEVTGEENHRGDEGLKEAAPERRGTERLSKSSSVISFSAVESGAILLK